MMENKDIILLGLTTLVAAIGWALRELYGTVKSLIIDMSDMKTKTSLIEQKSTGDIDKLTKITEMHITTLNATVEKQATNIEELTKQIINLTTKIGANNVMK